MFLKQGSANFFCKVSDNNHFRLWGYTLPVATTQIWQYCKSRLFTWWGANKTLL